MVRWLSALIVVFAGAAAGAARPVSAAAPSSAPVSLETAPTPIQVDARCGDYRCEPPEDCHSCSQDCGSCCGNHHCEPPEDCRSCPQDCCH